MTSLDASIIVITLVFLLRGIWVGFIRQLASIAALVLGYVFAGRYYEQLSPLLKPFIASPQIGFFVTYALIFLAVFLAVVAIGFVLKKVMTVSLLGWFDRLLGGIFGLSKAVIVCTLGFMLLSGVLASSNPLISKSFATPYLSSSTQFFLSFIKDQELYTHFLPRTPAISLPDLPIPASKTKRAEASKVAQ